MIHLERVSMKRDCYYLITRLLKSQFFVKKTAVSFKNVLSER